MFKNLNHSSTKRGIAAVAALSLLLGVQTAVWARPMDCTENAGWIAGDCASDPRGFPGCIDAKCTALYGWPSSGYACCAYVAVGSHP